MSFCTSCGARLSNSDMRNPSEEMVMRGAARRDLFAGALAKGIGDFLNDRPHIDRGGGRPMPSTDSGGWADRSQRVPAVRPVTARDAS